MPFPFSMTMFSMSKFILVKKSYLLGLNITAKYLHILLRRPASVTIRRFMTLALPTFLTYPTINNISMVTELFHTYITLQI